MKKALILLLAICLCLSFIVPSFAATSCPKRDCDGLGIYQYSTWSEKDGELVWTKVYKCSECGWTFPVYY